MSLVLKTVTTAIIFLCCIVFCNAQFSFSYEGPDTLYVGDDCTAILDWGHPETPDVFPTMPGQVIISWMIVSISGGYMIGDPVPAGQVVTVFYQARDNMGHIALFGFNIYFRDNTPPTFDPASLPPDITVTCDEEIEMPDLVFMDNCDSDSTETTIAFNETGDPDACAGGQMQRVWTITDAFGNTASFVQDITVTPDTLDPIITGFPVNGTAVCGNVMDSYSQWLAAQRATFNAQDVGCGILELTDNAPPASALVGFCGTLEISFFATDSCDNIASVIVEFDVTNNVAPTITTQASDGMTSCSSGDPHAAFQTWINTHGGAQATDDCSIVTWSTDPVDPSLDDVCNAALTVTFIADDGCGNTASTTAEFFVEDQTAPTITTQAQNVVLNCSTSDFEAELAEWISLGANAAATDICTDEDSLQIEFRLNGTLIDSLGIINAFQDSITNGTCEDGVIINGFLWNNVLARITIDFVFIDNCGNTASTPGIFAIRDGLGPVWNTVSQDTVLSCVGGEVVDLFTAWFESGGFAESSDDCGSIYYIATPSYPEALSALEAALDTACAAAISIEVQFQLNDFCGNSNPTIETAVFGIEADEGPQLVSQPQDLEFGCTGDVGEALIAWLDSLGGAEVQQSCGGITWSFQWEQDGETLSGVPGVGPYPDPSLVSCNTSLQVTFAASDACENVVSGDAVFSSVDTIAPVITLVSEITIPCDSVALVEVMVSDNCSANPDLDFTQVNMGGDTTECLSGTIIRTWTATDACGNTSSAIQTIHTDDTEAPQFVVPADTVIYCSGDSVLDTGFPMLITDNCDASPEVMSQDSISGSACELTLTREWIVIDACGNSSSAIQTISLIDTLAPSVITEPSNLVLSCQNPEGEFAVWIEGGAGIQLADNCSTVDYFLAVPGSYELSDTTTWPGTLPVFPEIMCGNDTLGSGTVDIVYTDACGNAGVESVQFVLVDNEGPQVADCLADTTIMLASGECETQITLSPPVAVDLCQATFDTLTYEQVLPVSSSAPGDSSVVVDSLVFGFTVPGLPSVPSDPVDIEVILSGVDADGPQEFFAVFDENGENLGTTLSLDAQCDTGSLLIPVPTETFTQWYHDGEISFTLHPDTTGVDSANINDICPDATVTIRFTVVVATSDSLAYSWSIDTFPRVVLDIPSDITVDVFAGTHTLTWYLSDCAGNETECSTTIQVVDSDAPIVNCPPDTILTVTADAGCSVPLTIVRPVSSDFCGINDTTARFSVSGDTLIADTYFGSEDSLVAVLNIGTYTITYGISDLSGNTAECSFNALIRDEIAPTAVCQPGTAFIHPSGVIPLVVDPLILDGGSMDNCGIDSMYVIPSTFTCDEAGIVQNVQLVVVDAAGNADTCVAELTLEVEALQPSYTIGICAEDTLHLFANVPFAPGNPYTFSWTGPGGFVSTEENPQIPGVNATHAGLYTVVATGAGGCTSVGSVDVEASDDNRPLIESAEEIVCEEQPVLLSSGMYNQQVTYRWYRGVAPGGLLIGSTSEPQFSEIPPVPGTYQYYVIVETVNCASDPSLSVSVEVIETPIATVQAPFIEICAGESFSLGTEVSGQGIAYTWTGPNGYISNEQFPEPITDAEPEDAGVYSLVISIGGCMSLPATTDVVISPRPDRPVIEGDSISCEGGMLVLSIINVDNADQYIWQNPQMNAISTTTNVLTLNDITEAMEGFWTVVAMLGQCPSAESEPFQVTVEESLPIEASNDGPVCEGSGDSVTLSVTIIPGVEYVWAGPGGFTSTEANPTLVGVEGTYSVTATSGSGCTAIATTVIETEDPPAITALSNNGIACADSSDNLMFAFTVFPADNGSYSYFWTGPNGFVSNEMNPVIPGLTDTLNGTYTLVVALGSCMSDPVSTTVMVGNSPAQPVIDAPATTFCSGETIVINGPAFGDSVLYIWNTPTGIVELWDHPVFIIDHGTVTNSGSYSLTLQINGCESPVSDPIVINVTQGLPQPVVVGIPTLCTGDTIELSTPFVEGATYLWNGPGFTSMLQNPFIFPTSVANSGSYSVQVQIGDCISDPADPLVVTVLPLPSVPAIVDVPIDICLGDPEAIEFCITQSAFTQGAVYTWTIPGEILATTDQRCFILDDFSTFTEGAQTISVNAVLNGCEAISSAETIIDMFEVPEADAFAGVDRSFCADEIPVTAATVPQIGTGLWSSPDPSIFFPNGNIATTVVNQLSEGENILVWTLSYEACVNYSSDTVIFTIVPTPLAVNDTVTVPFGQTVDIEITLNDLISGSFDLELLPGGPDKGNVLLTGPGTITYDPNLGYVGPDHLSYEICSEECPVQCTIAEVFIQVGDETDCFIPSIFTPNSDGTNDRLIIPCLETERFPDNRIVIFNEWGDAVYEAQPYLNDWEGTREGKDLPVATYFYLVDFGDGRPVQNGFLILER